MASLLFVHAHPDDETLWTGVAIAHHVRRGDSVHVLTCTLGEEGEVIPAELKHLELPAGQPRRPDVVDELALVRRAELRCAAAALGVASSSVLAELDEGGGYRDSGMVGTPSADHPRAFTAAPITEVASRIAGYIDRLGIDTVVTYDAHGGYGHPDHMRVHQVTLQAAAVATRSPVVFATVTPRRWAVEDRQWLAAATLAPGIQAPGPDEPLLPSVVEDDVPAVELVDATALDIQREALCCHRTQVSVFDGYFALSNNVAVRLAGREAFVQVDPATGAFLPHTDIAADLTRS